MQILRFLFCASIVCTANAQVTDSQLIRFDSNIHRSEPSENLLKLYVNQNETEVEVRIEISHSGLKEIFVGKTPFEYRFTASKYHIYYESLDPDSLVIAQLFSDRYGEYRLISGNGTGRWTGEMSRKGIFFSTND